MINLTIVITFYNNAQYIDNCIKNIKKIANDIEIIIMDDGSEKNNYEKIEKKIQTLKNKNIKLIRNSKNMGAGYTKNKAVEISNGKYIIFLDCDDYVDNNYYSKIIETIDLTNADIICTDIVPVIGKKICNESILETSIIREQCKKISSNIFEVSPKVILGNKYSASACNKAIKKEYLLKYKFNENKCDDLTAIIPILCKAKKIMYISDIKYYYCQTQNSITRQNAGKSKRENLIDSIDSLLKTYNILEEDEIIESNIEIFYANNIIPFIYFSIFNNDFISCLLALKYLQKKINSKNFANYLTISNPYLYRLTYLDSYSIELIKEIKNKTFSFLILKIFIGRLNYKLKIFFRRVK